MLSLQSSVAKLSESVTADNNENEALRQQLVGQVLQRDQPPIWSPAFWSAGETSSIRQDLKKERDRRLEAASTFLAESQEDVLVHIVVTLLFGGLMFSIRPRVMREMKADPEMEQVRAIFDHPISLTLLCSFFVAYVWISPSHPMLSPVIGAATLIPAIVILRRLVDPPIYPMLNALIVFFLVDRIRALIAPLPVLARLVHLAELAAIVVLVLYWLRPARLHQIPAQTAESPIFRIVGLALKVALAQAVIGMLAEMLGFSRLAHVLGDVTAMAGYAGVVLYGATQVINSMIAFLLRVRPFTRLVMVRRRRRLIHEGLYRAIQWAAWGVWIAATLSAGRPARKGGRRAVVLH